MFLNSGSAIASRLPALLHVVAQRVDTTGGARSVAGPASTSTVQSAGTEPSRSRVTFFVWYWLFASADLTPE